MRALTAHIVELVPADPFALGSLLLTIGVVALVVALMAEHHVVKHGAVRLDRLVRPAAAVAALAVAAAVLPGSAASQDREIPVGLPDLVSDPPFIWFDRPVVQDDGSVIRTLSFDGYLRNNGPGVLELFGNPQVPGDVKQRWWDGEDWVEVAAPRVLYETTDDHNHFHLMAAAEYELWDEGRTGKVGDASKVGFCLLDSLQRAEGHDAFYDIVAFNYCGQDDPGADELRMGITPGWVDLYDANTTLQWVDVSTTEPGWYWVGSIIDPENQIVESDETNNELVFSENKFAVAGAVARPIATQTAGEPITLRADLVELVGDVAWKITAAPRNGTLSVPVGVDLFDPEIVYTPNPGFTGIDEFAYSARDVRSPFPLEPTEVVVAVDASEPVSTDSSASPPVPAAPRDPSASTTGVAGETVLTESQRFELAIENFAIEGFAFEEIPIDAMWFASDLPPGLRIDPATGQISGVPALATPGQATVLALSPGGEAEAVTFTFDWSVEPFEQLALVDLNDFSTAFAVPVRYPFGPRTPDATYEAVGLPPGIDMAPSVAVLGGTPTEIGDFDVTITTTVDGEVTESTSFTWTVRPSTVPAFPL